MLLGLAAGRWMRSVKASAIVVRRLLAAGGILIAAGLLLHFGGICPIVKRIWTPAWTLFSGGLCFLFLAAFYWATEVKGWRRWAFPLLVIGTNSLAAYVIAHFGVALRPRHSAHSSGSALLSPFWARHTSLCCAGSLCSRCTGWRCGGCTAAGYS
ncbi:MAG: hypothetical protein WDO73_31615, partial [Ignavibacteriota bacterium]